MAGDLLSVYFRNDDTDFDEDFFVEVIVAFGEARVGL